MCSPLFTLMRKEKLPFGIRFASARPSRCDLRHKDSTSLPTQFASAVVEEEEEEERSSSCLSSASTAFRSVGGSVGSGDLLCGRFRIFTEELKGKFARRKNVNRYKHRNSIEQNSREKDSEEEEEEPEEETEKRQQFNGVRLRSSEFQGSYILNNKRNDLNNNTNRSNSRSRNLNEEEEEESIETRNTSNDSLQIITEPSESRSPFVHRALPPLPPPDQEDEVEDEVEENKTRRRFRMLESASSIALDRHHSQNDSDQSEEDTFNHNSHSPNRRQLLADFGQRRQFNGYLPPPHIHPRRLLHELNFENQDQSNEETFQTDFNRNLSKATITSGQALTTGPTNLINLNNNLIRESSTTISSRLSEISMRPMITKTTKVPLLAANDEEMRKMLDYAASIEKVKDCGWYWGPISGERAERLLASEPDGSFIVRDSSDEHYIFSLTFKLNGSVRHVRIEHDQGNFSFGSLQKFSSSTIVDFIQDAVEHSRSGRYLFFLHRLPVMGPMRVQLLHPVSRFKQIQSLQHLCRFVILRHVRRDLIPGLPLPDRVKKYLNTTNYYTEKITG